MASYVFDQFGYFKEVFEETFNGVEVEHERSVTFPPAFIPDYPRENGKPWFVLTPRMDAWRLVTYQSPPELTSVNQKSLTQGEFMKLIGFPKLAEIEALARTDVEVSAAWKFGQAFPSISLDDPLTTTLLGLLGTKGILTTEEIDKISNNQPI